jgi:putative salt-induced outer membrane protein YdiY
MNSVNFHRNPLAAIVYSLSVFVLVLGLSAEAADAKPPQLGLSNDSELGVVLTSGNARAQSINLKQEDEYAWTLDKVVAGYRYLSNSSNGTETARVWDGNLRYERSLAPSLAVYVAQGIEADPYSGYDQRLNSDIGGKYNIAKTDTTGWTAELGYRYTSEHRTTPPNLYSNFGRVYTELSRNWTATSSTKLWLECLPNFSHPNAFLLNSEISTSSVLTTLVSVKLGYLFKYNADPTAGITQKADTFFTTALVAKF